MQMFGIIKTGWDKDKCRCECKELIECKGSCDKGFMQNPSSCEYECGKSCNVGEYLDYENLDYDNFLNAIPLNI